MRGQYIHSKSNAAKQALPSPIDMVAAEHEKRTQKQPVAEAKQHPPVGNDSPTYLFPPLDDEEKQSDHGNDEVVLPGAVRIGGISQQTNSQSTLYENVDDNVTILQARPVLSAEVVREGEDELVQQILSVLRHNVVEAEVVGPPTQSSVSLPLDASLPAELPLMDKNNGEKAAKTCRLIVTRRYSIAFAVLATLVIVIAVVVVVLVLAKKSLQPITTQRPNSTLRPTSVRPSTTQHPTTIHPSTMQRPTTFRPTTSQPPTLPPTATQGAVLSLTALQSLLLKQSVSTHQDLFNKSTPQYQALNWLVNENPAMLDASTPLETVINRYIMVVIYFANNGNNWAHHSNFLSGESICMWHNDTSHTGIFCNPFEVKFGSNNLTGTILTELGRLSGLVTLELQENILSGTIPPELGALTELTSFNLYLNWLIGTIPSALARLTRLTVFDLSSNQLSGTITTEFGHLLHMQAFELEYINNLSGTIPTELSKMVNLTSLLLGLNHINGTIPSVFGRLSLLQVLELWDNPLTGTVPTLLAALPNLTNLNIMGTDIKGNLTPFFCNRTTPWNRFVADCLFEVACNCCTWCY